tara:strand:- start:18 stop:422 length:405 start_codon:yes stop_codon:yes gene_type:complete
MKNIISTTLSNGLKVVNFCSNHSAFNKNSNVAFTFEDGSILENVLMKITGALSMEVIDETIDNGKFTVVKKGFKLTTFIVKELKKVQMMSDVDIIIVPFPMLVALEKEGLNHKCFTCDLNRQTKFCSISRFCSL